VRGGLGGEGLERGNQEALGHSRPSACGILTVSNHAPLSLPPSNPRPVSVSPEESIHPAAVPSPNPIASGESVRPIAQLPSPPPGASMVPLSDIEGDCDTARPATTGTADNNNNNDDIQTPPPSPGTMKKLFQKRYQLPQKMVPKMLLVPRAM